MQAMSLKVMLILFGSTIGGMLFLICAGLAPYSSVATGTLEARVHNDGSARREDKFVVFGCWNHGTCNTCAPASNGMSQVFHNLTLGNRNPKLAPSFYIIAGDNYYPSKTLVTSADGKRTKKKTFDRSALQSGFSCLEALTNQSNATAYVLMGNHDYQLEDDFGDCRIVNAQQEFFEKPATRLDTRTTMLRKGDTLFLFIDTNLYDGTVPAIQHKYAKCELAHQDAAKHGAHEEHRAVNDMIAAQQSHLLDQVSKIDDKASIKHVFISGHHPILGVKSKKGKIKKQEMNKHGVQFVVHLLSLFPKSKHYYLCADIHHYQKGTLTLAGLNGSAVRQFIVGTGGASLDKEPPETGSRWTTEDGQVELLTEGSNVGYGYLEVQRNDKQYEFQFIQLAGLELGQKAMKVCKAD